jgi:hypothetical protein
MKKFLMILSCVLALCVVGQAQVTTMPLALGDTAVDAGVADKVFEVTAGYEGVIVQAIVTKISGTVAGTVGLYGSLDGTNYKQIGSDFTATNVASQTHVFYVTAPVARYLKVVQTGSGTMSAVLTVKYLARKRH